MPTLKSSWAQQDQRLESDGKIDGTTASAPSTGEISGRVCRYGPIFGVSTKARNRRLHRSQQVRSRMGGQRCRLVADVNRVLEIGLIG
jgi:hypothetical protein